MVWQKISEALGLEPGGATRTALQGLWGSLTGNGSEFVEQPEPRNSATFTIAVVTLSAKMAKADGVALTIEAETFHRLFDIPESQRSNVERLYQLAKRDTAGFEIYSEQIARLLAGHPKTLRWVLDCLFHIASSDGVLHPEEDKFLKRVAEKFEINEKEFISIRSGFVTDPDSPYTILGISADVSDAELKAHHRRLVVENHPDRLIGKGMPTEFRAAADRRLRNMNAAYDDILKQRGMKPVMSAERVP